MGVTVREKDSAWWIFINHQGKRKAKRVGIGDPGKKAAQSAAAKIQAKLVLGDVGIFETPATPATVPTFAAIAEDWRRHTAPEWKIGTKITYENALKARLLPAFGTLPISDVTPALVEAWWTAAREEGLSKNHLGNLRALLRGICRRAVSEGHLHTNPVERIEGRLGRKDT
jgi:integrase